MKLIEHTLLAYQNDDLGRPLEEILLRTTEVSQISNGSLRNTRSQSFPYKSLLLVTRLHSLIPSDMVDITSALAAPTPSELSKGKRKAVESDTDDEDDEIYAQSARQRFKDGTDVVKGMAHLKKKANVKGGGSFQAMGASIALSCLSSGVADRRRAALSPALLRSLLMRGFTTPTPIQRAAMPAILASPPRDLVGMARTGSGKTLAYLVPLIQRLNTVHSASFGARALILVPTRELAMQVLLVGKDIARGAKEGGGEPLRWAMIVGGDSLEDQFSLVASNPDMYV